MSKAPDKIQVKNGNLVLGYSDSQVKTLSLEYMREECPCAGCKGETILFTTYKGNKPEIKTPEMYKITGIEPVGGYAIKITWKDGHDTGLYSWDYIQTLIDSQESGTRQEYTKLI